MQAFNSPIWLALEDYALDHAREDEMKISVFTGPYLEPDDPVRFGVRIPVKFWKVIAFIHDDTGQLCATGYEMSQERSLPPPDEEFVFGQFMSPQLGIATQVSIRSIEKNSGLSFNGLADVDPLASDDEAIDFGSGAALPLAMLEQIRFTA
jgi:endonuclease G, mitochondrial